jgi:hypothetical protein
MIFLGLSESASPVINGYEIKSFSDIKLQTKKIASCLSSYEKTFRALREAELSRLDKSKTGFQVDDLIYVGGKASCIGSLFYKYNFLLFKNFEKNSFFYLIQSNIVCAGFYIPDYDLLLAKPGVLAAFKKGSSAARLKKRLSRHLSLNKRSSMPAMLSGWLDGYQRPYHYFYDRLPSLIRYKNFCSDLQSTSLKLRL